MGDGPGRRGTLEAPRAHSLIPGLHPPLQNPWLASFPTPHPTGDPVSHFLAQLDLGLQGPPGTPISCFISILLSHLLSAGISIKCQPVPVDMLPSLPLLSSAWISMLALQLNKIRLNKQKRLMCWEVFVLGVLCKLIFNLPINLMGLKLLSGFYRRGN